MKKNKYTQLLFCAFIAVSASICLFSCVKEELSGIEGGADYNSVTINVRMPAPVVTTPMTRAGAPDFDQMSDINIAIADEKDNISHILYFSFADVTNNRPIADGLDVYYTDEEKEGEGVVRSFNIQILKDWLLKENISANTCQFYIVGNWGKAINKDEVPTANDLKKLEAKSITVGGTAGWIQAPNVMFGKIIEEKSETHTHPGTDERDMCRMIAIELERTAAMVTVTMEAPDLDDGIIIKPRTVSLHNVPTTCLIGQENVVTADKISRTGETKDFGSGEFSLAGNGTIANPPGTIAASTLTTAIGKHYEYDNDNPTGDLSDQSVASLFLYENYHGAGYGATDVTTENQWQKRPAGVGNTLVEIETEANEGTCSYIEVTADYFDANADGETINQYGSATWRFFLGDNVTDNFDVLRNHYYKITLTLSGTGIGEENYSWRVESDLTKPVIATDAQMVLGGGGEAFRVSVQNSNKNLTISTEGTPFVYIRVSDGPNGHNYTWQTGNQIEGNRKIEVDNEDYIWFYVQPMIRDVTWFGEGHERTYSITFLPNGSPSTTVRFTQYEPLKIEVGYDDVSDLEDTDMQQVKTIIETYYNYKFVEGDPDGKFVMYLDRVDRNSMAWGFEGVELDKNHITGFENVYHLIDPKEPKGEHCQNHIDFAKHYLPTGRNYDNTYDRGSCMMHAAMENFWMQWYDGDIPYTSQQLSDWNTLPPRPGQGDGVDKEGLSFGWCVPSIVGWQLIEKIDRHYREHKGIPSGIFDPEHPIVPWYSYWTSNAGTLDMVDVYPGKADGKTNAFVYQFGRGLDAVTMESKYGEQYLVDRKTELHYRLLNINPKHLLDKDQLGDDDDPLFGDEEGN